MGVAEDEGNNGTGVKAVAGPDLRRRCQVAAMAVILLALAVSITSCGFGMKAAVTPVTVFYL